MKKIFIIAYILIFLLVQNKVFAQEQNDIDALQQKIKTNWILPKKLYGQSAIITFKINKDGTVSDKEFLTTSGDEKFDQSILKAIDKSSPFKDMSGNVQIYFNQNEINATISQEEVKTISEEQRDESDILNINNLHPIKKNRFVEIRKELSPIRMINDFKKNPRENYNNSCPLPSSIYYPAQENVVFNKVKEFKIYVQRFLSHTL